MIEFLRRVTQQPDRSRKHHVLVGTNERVEPVRVGHAALVVATVTA